MKREHRGTDNEAQCTLPQFRITGPTLAGTMSHDLIDRALVLLAASVQMLGPWT
jgi:hypothetical protein